MIDVDEEWRKRLREEEGGDDSEDVNGINGVGNKGALFHLLRLMLRWEPIDRPAPADLLEHPWLTS
jgi:hypothetical protein